MTWKNRWPTAEEARAHAENYGQNGRGAWLLRTEVSVLLRTTWICSDVAGNGPHYVDHTGLLRRCDYEGWTHQPQLCPIDFDGHPVPWPETAAKRRSREGDAVATTGDRSDYDGSIPDLGDIKERIDSLQREPANSRRVFDAVKPSDLEHDGNPVSWPGEES